MDEFRNEAEEFDDDVFEEEEVAEEEVFEEDEGANAARMAEAADLQKLLKQHPDIWIPLKEQVQERLLVKGPTDAFHKTYPILTRYEYTKIISFRASQIANGAKPYVLVPEGMTDAYEIAKMELLAKRLPVILKRPLPNGNFETWKLADLAIVH
jgi:DNA-directed RNA polymerase subunit K/omega